MPSALAAGEVATTSSAARSVWASPLYRGATVALFLSGLGTSAAAPQITLFLVNDLHVSLTTAGLFYLTNITAPLAGYLIGGLVMVASGYGFCHVQAKTDDHYFRGFPSYWNLVAFYLYCLELGALASTVIVAVFAVMVFVPIKYIYPNRTGPLRALTLTLAIAWAMVTLAMLPALPRHNPALLYASLSFIAYYLIASFILHARAAMKLRRYRSGG